MRKLEIKKEESSYTVDTRYWDRVYELWLEDSINNSMPGRHPIDEHPWNRKPELWTNMDDEDDSYNSTRKDAKSVASTRQDNKSEICICAML